MKRFKINLTLLGLAGILFLSSALSAQDEKSGGESAEEVAQKLNNPNATLGSMTFPIDYINYQGDLPDASRQNAFKINFQPSLPYSIAEGVNFFLRPLIPIIITQPVPGENGFENKGVHLGDIVVDAAVGKTWKGGWITVLGVFASMPTATDASLGSGRWLIGPELLLAKLSKWGVLAVLVTQSWSVSGNAEGNLSVFGGQYFYTVNLKNAWQIKAQPTFSINFKASGGNKVDFPIGTGIAKTVSLGKIPVQFGLQYWYHIVSPELFGPEHQIRVVVQPVIPLPW
jgi:hypothetical protein